MGGLGSGRRWYTGSYETTDDYRKLDVRQIHSKGLLTPNHHFTWRWTRDNEIVAQISIRSESACIWLSYRYRSQGSDWEDISYPVQIDWTRCNLGGQRPWFLCPALNCGRRVAILYGCEVFACRKCHRLVYESQRENADDRAVRRADKIRERLNWLPGIANGRFGKPKGMHWKTYRRLITEYDACVRQSIQGISKKFELLGMSFDDYIDTDDY